MPEEKEEHGLEKHTVVLMICVAVFFDLLQWLLFFIAMDWLAGIFAGLTFFVWFRMHGISFMKPKRLLTFGGAAISELIPFWASIPAWTAAVAYLALSSKIKKVVPGLGIIKK